MRQSRSVIIMFAVLIPLATASVAATQAPDSTPSRPRPTRGALAPAEVVAMLDAYAVVQAQDALQLNDNQYGTFVTRLKKLQETRRKNQQTRNQLIQNLRRLAGPGTSLPYDENAIRTGLKNMQERHARTRHQVPR